MLIHVDESDIGGRSPDDVESVTQAVDRFDNEITQTGQNIGSIRLRPSMTATTVRVRNGKTLIVDRPFAETKEQLG